MKKLIILLIAIYAFGCNRGTVYTVSPENMRKPTFITKVSSFEIDIPDSSWTTLEASLDSTTWTTLDTLFSDTSFVNNIKYRFYRLKSEGGSNVRNIDIQYRFYSDSVQVYPTKMRKQ